MNAHFHFAKIHGLGNEYIVLHPDFQKNLSEKAIKTICNIHFGIGSDGILVSKPTEKADFGLRILNPDGSEAEKSGNGLRIFSKFLYDYGFAKSKSFSIDTLGGLVKSEIIQEKNSKAEIIQVEMGKPTFIPHEIPVKSNLKGVLDMEIQLSDTSFTVNCVSVGNPHCVRIVDELKMEELLKYGPEIENHPVFPNRTNVQFVHVISREKAKMLIWERGAGHTLASGSSSSGVASILKKKGLIGDHVEIYMEGGSLTIDFDDWTIFMTGEVKEVATGIFSNEFLNEVFDKEE